MFAREKKKRKEEEGGAAPYLLRKEKKGKGGRPSLWKKRKGRDVCKKRGKKKKGKSGLRHWIEGEEKEGEGTVIPVLVFGGEKDAESLFLGGKKKKEKGNARLFRSA